MSSFHRCALAAVVILGAALAPAHASAESGIVERIVAVVGAEPILLSEMRERAEPFLIQVRERISEGPQRAAAMSSVYHDLIFKMIDDELIAREGARQGVVVAPAEIDAALVSVAASAGVTVPELIRKAAQQGLDEAAYRRELERQLLGNKLLIPWGKQRATFTDAELRERFDRAVVDERARLPYRASAIVLRLPPRGAPGVRAGASTKLAQAAKIVARVRAGEDFAALREKLSEEPRPKPPKGASPPSAPPLTTPGQGARTAAEEAALGKLEPGQITEPIDLGDTIVILRLDERARPRLVSFEDSRAVVREQLVYDKLEALRKAWIETLRAATYVEVSL